MKRILLCLCLLVCITGFVHGNAVLEGRQSTDDGVSVVGPVSFVSNSIATETSTTTDWVYVTGDSNASTTIVANTQTISGSVEVTYATVTIEEVPPETLVPSSSTNNAKSRDGAIAGGVVGAVVVAVIAVILYFFVRRKKHTAKRQTWRNQYLQQWQPDRKEAATTSGLNDLPFDGSQAVPLPPLFIRAEGHRRSQSQHIEMNSV